MVKTDLDYPYIYIYRKRQTDRQTETDRVIGRDRETERWPEGIRQIWIFIFTYLYFYCFRLVSIFGHR